MPWYEYLAGFFAGVFLANAVPHFVHGISGNKFPTPFAKPPGRGLSSPFVNVMWAFVNFSTGFALLSVGLRELTPFSVGSILAGAFAISAILSFWFQRKLDK